MKLTCYILMKNNSIIKKKVTNPSLKFNLSYKVDNEKSDFEYNFNREKKFIIKRFLGHEHACFYEHSNPEPLDASFKTKELELKAINELGKSRLISDLVASTKNKQLEMNVGLILGLAGIALIGFIVFLSKNAN